MLSTLACFLRASRESTPTSASSGSARPRWQAPSCLPLLWVGSPFVLRALGSDPQTSYRKAANSAIRTPNSAPQAATAAFPIPFPSARSAQRQDAALTWQPPQRGREGRPWEDGSQLLSAGWRALGELQADNAIGHLLTPGKQSRK